MPDCSSLTRMRYAVLDAVSCQALMPIATATVKPAQMAHCPRCAANRSRRGQEGGLMPCKKSSNASEHGLAHLRRPPSRHRGKLPSRKVVERLAYVLN